MKSAGKARNNGLYRHIRTSKEIIRNLLNDYYKKKNSADLFVLYKHILYTVDFNLFYPYSQYSFVI